MNITHDKTTDKHYQRTSFKATVHIFRRNFTT